MEYFAPTIWLIYQEYDGAHYLRRQFLQLWIKNTIQQHIDATRPRTHFRITRRQLPNLLNNQITALIAAFFSWRLILSFRVSSTGNSLKATSPLTNNLGMVFGDRSIHFNINFIHCNISLSGCLFKPSPIPLGSLFSFSNIRQTNRGMLYFLYN